MAKAAGATETSVDLYRLRSVTSQKREIINFPEVKILGLSKCGTFRDSRVKQVSWVCNERCSDLQILCCKLLLQVSRRFWIANGEELGRNCVFKKSTITI